MFTSRAYITFTVTAVALITLFARSFAVSIRRGEVANQWMCFLSYSIRQGALNMRLVKLKQTHRGPISVNELAIDEMLTHFPP